MTKILEGMAEFMVIAPNVPVARIRRSWQQIRAAVPDAQEQSQKLENLFTWIVEARAKNIPGFDGFVSKGPGSIAHSTAGFYHALEFIIALEKKVGNRFVDVLTVDGRRIELKNLIADVTDLSARAALRSQLLRQLTREEADAVFVDTLR